MLCKNSKGDKKGIEYMNVLKMQVMVKALYQHINEVKDQNYLSANEGFLPVKLKKASVVIYIALMKSSPPHNLHLQDVLCVPPLSISQSLYSPTLKFIGVLTCFLPFFYA